MTKSRLLLLAAIVFAAVCFRIAPYVLNALDLTDVRQITGFFWNFSPISALFLFCGAQFADRRCAYGAPLAAMLLSDIGIGLLLRDMSMGLHPAIPAIYASYALIVFSGTLLRRVERRIAAERSSAERPSFAQRIVTESLWLAGVAGAGIVGEIVFFAVTNFAAWCIQTGYYSHTWDGLMTCYVAGIPFFKNALQSTALYGFMLFGGAALAESWFPALRDARAETAPAEQAAIA